MVVYYKVQRKGREWAELRITREPGKPGRVEETGVTYPSERKGKEAILPKNLASLSR